MSFSKLPEFWVNPIYKDGSVIDGFLIDAARELWPEAAYVTDKLISDVGRTGEIMETAVHQVWPKVLEGAIENLSRIRNYLRTSFYNVLLRIAWRENWLVDSDPRILVLDQDRNRLSFDLPTLELQHDSCRLPKRQTKAGRWLWAKRDTYGDHLLKLTSFELDRLLGRLTVRERTLIKLYWIEGYTWKNISEQTGIPVTTAKVVASRALAKLRRFARTKYNPAHGEAADNGKK